MTKIKFIEEKKMNMMTTGSHCKGSKTSHSKRKYVKEEYINRMSQEEYDRELVDIGLQLIHLEMLLQKENHKYGWILRNTKMRWNSLQVKLRKNMSARLKEEIGIVEFEMDVLGCEPKHGPLFREDVTKDAEKERLTESLMDSVKSTDQLMEEMNVRPIETKRSYIFETDDFFVITSFVADDKQYFETI